MRGLLVKDLPGSTLESVDRHSLMLLLLETGSVQ